MIPHQGRKDIKWHFVFTSILFKVCTTRYSREMDQNVKYKTVIRFFPLCFVLYFPTLLQLSMFFLVIQIKTKVLLRKIFVTELAKSLIIKGFFFSKFPKSFVKGSFCLKLDTFLQNLVKINPYDSNQGDAVKSWILFFILPCLSPGQKERERLLSKSKDYRSYPGGILAKN